MKYILAFFAFLLPLTLHSQETTKIYNPNADASSELSAAINKASEQNKHVLIQVGGNWCPWCLKLHAFFHAEQKLDSILNADYVVIRINFSPENRNHEVLAGLGYPQRFGFPVLLVLDGKGNRLHTQDTGYLELDKGYDAEKIERFLMNWNKRAVDPGSYVQKFQVVSGN